jgi:hypothetical protein
MRISRNQLRSIVRQEASQLMEAKSSHEVRFKDVAGLAHTAKLYDAIGKLHDLLIKKVGAVPSQRWLRELVKDALTSHLEDFVAQDRMMKGKGDD